MLANNGFKVFYNSWSDYLPGYLYFLWGLGKINLLGLVPQEILFKIPAIVSDLATGFLIYKILSRSKSQKWGIIGASLYIFNPAILANSALWGQVDSLTALTSILSVYLVPLNYILSAIVLALGTAIKPQTAFIFPVILFSMLKEKWEYRKILTYITTGLLVFFSLFAPFWNHGNLFSFVFERLNISLNQYPFTSLNAFNFWGLLGFWKSDNLYFQFSGYILVLFSTLFLFFKTRKIKNPEYLLMSFLFASSFIFFTRIHERHLLPMLAPLVIVAVENPILLIPYLGFSATYVSNLYYSYVWISENFKEVFPEVFVKLLSLANIVLLIYLFRVIAKNIKSSWKSILSRINKFVNPKSLNVGKHTFKEIKISKKMSRLLLGGILVFAFITRIFNLGVPRSDYFDEVYHAFTARVILHGGVEAWEWWNTPPEGFAYEWTHPPLAKLGMVAGMKIFGENSFGWRIPGAILGVGAVTLIYFLAKKLFKDEIIGLFSAAVFSLDGLPLVLSRIGMNDSYILFFALLSIYLFLKEKDFLSAVSYGLALASKWSALWAAPILFVLWLKRKNKIKISTFVFFLLLPIGVYLLTYLPMFFTGHDLSIWWGMQKQMWWYHTGLNATHPYTSSWWSWPLLIRPIYLYTSEEVGGFVARIYAMGNPFIFWFGFASVVMSFIYSYLERNKNLGFVVFSYLIFFVPWAVSPRIMFLYHYLPSLPFLAIATAYILRRNPKLAFGYFFICLLGFVYFYPHWAGFQVPLWLDRSYYWLASWR